MSDATTIKTAIDEQVRAVAKSKGMEIETVDEDLDFFGSGIFDSLGLISMMNKLETQFGIQIDFSELEPEEFTTVSGLGRVIAAAFDTETKD